MKKFLFFASLILASIASINAQEVFYSDFESWDNANTPTNWIGAATNINSADVDQYTSSPYAGSYSMQITNTGSTHKRVSTKSVSVTNGAIYNVSYYVKGVGEIRSGLYKGATGRYTNYTSYENVNTTSWIKVTQTVISDTTSATAEFVLSVRNTNASGDHLQIDSFCVVLGTSNTVSVYDIQHTATDASSYVGQPISTGGVVSAVKTGAYWIQNGSGPWSGVYVYDNTHTPAIGDSITFSAIVDEYFGLTELKSISNYSLVSSGNTVHVTTLDIPDTQLEMYEGVLCKVVNVECTAMPDTYMEWKVGDGMDDLKVVDLIFAYTPTLGTFYDITGVMYYNFNERKIQPRSAADVSVHTGIKENEINAYVYPNPASNFINVSAEIEGIINIVDLAGRVVYSENFLKNATIDIMGIPSGIYNMVINGNNDEIAVKQFIVE